jgi:hypothetical protein
LYYNTAGIIPYNSKCHSIQNAKVYKTPQHTKCKDIQNATVDKMKKSIPNATATKCHSIQNATAYK